MPIETIPLANLARDLAAGRTSSVALTEACLAGLEDPAGEGARAVTREIGGLLTRARSLLQGVEAEVSFAVDVMLPTSALTGILDAFRAARDVAAACRSRRRDRATRS